MGKSALILAIAGLVTTSMLLFNTEHTSMETNQRQAERDEEVLAREIARSGYNAVRSKAVQLQQSGNSVSTSHLVNEVNGGPNSKITGSYKSGTYEAWIERVSSEAYMVHAIGRYGKAEHTMAGPKTEASGFTTQPTLTVVTESTLEVEFLESMAGYCSAIYLQRIPPKSNNGHGNNIDGVDSSNPGNSHHGEDSDPNVDDERGGGGGGRTPDPELIFVPGNNRNGAIANYETVLQPGWRVNFILAVDADMNCEDRGRTVNINDRSFDYTRPALLAGVGDLDDMQEGKYAIIQQKPSVPGVWRIAFEDLVFSDAQLADVKKNGYGNGSWRKVNKKYTYGGSGWSALNSAGYYQLRDFGSMPDFSDQVIEVRLMDVETVVVSN